MGGLLVTISVRMVDVLTVATRLVVIYLTNGRSIPVVGSGIGFRSEILIRRRVPSNRIDGVDDVLDAAGIGWVSYPWHVDTGMLWRRSPDGRLVGGRVRRVDVDGVFRESGIERHRISRMTLAKDVGRVLPYSRRSLGQIVEGVSEFVVKEALDAVAVPPIAHRSVVAVAH